MAGDGVTMGFDPELRRHQDWLGYLQPIGITVAPAALHAAGANLQTNIAEEQERFLQHIENGSIKDFAQLCHEFLGWQSEDLVSKPPDLGVRLPEYNETLAPDFGVKGVPGESEWLMLVRLLPTGTNFDEPETKERERWNASPQARFERLLRETKNPIGLLVNGEAVRLVFAPQGESSGHLTFPVSAMCEIAGRPILAAFHLLFYFDRLFQLSKRERLPSILEESRKYQNQVSTALSKQVLEALHELMAGLHAADAGRNFGLLRDVLQQSPSEVYGGLLTTLMRLVFLLYAEERGLLPGDPVWTRNYSIRHLYARLRDDARLHPDTMDQRYGAWAQLLVVFRIMYDGINHATVRIPPRHGKLFDPDAYPFLEGRPWGSRRVDVQVDPPKVSDGVVYRILENLLVLDGERLSYRALDVEQIGSVYEAMMGFEVRKAKGSVIALKPDDVCVEIDQILERKGADRAKFIRETAGCEVTGQALAEARSTQELLDAIGKKVSARTHDPLAPASLYLQPTEERRRSGSHYTPRSLTEPIVEKALEPILEDLGPRPNPDQILSLKVCDPAMGSGAFLVAACRLLAQRLLRAWIDHKVMPKIALEEDPVTHAMRLVAQKCLYGVDKNPFAVDLAKLSLWLATMAKEHAFTFLDHALRYGDSLVGLSREQIGSFHWEVQPQKLSQKLLVAELIAKAVKKAEDLRARIRDLAESDDTDQKARLLTDVESALEQVRLIGDSIVASFFGADTTKKRDALRSKHAGLVQNMLSKGIATEDLKAISNGLRDARKPIPCFHWPIEFPEVFRGIEDGFDVIVGNPPFAGKNTTTDANSEGYPEWLKAIHAESHGNSDLVAHFYRRAFNLIRSGGTFGLIATKTIGQGDTRSTGLRWICMNGGTIFRAKRRIKWPGAAAVVVSVVHIRKGEAEGPYLLDENFAPMITAYLFHAGGNEDPARLKANANKSFQGSIVLGRGFTFDDTDTKGLASSIKEMHRLIAKEPRNQDRIFPYIGGEEVATSPKHEHHRYVINFGEMSEKEARRWPHLISIIEEKVKGTRGAHSTAPWWQLERPRGELYDAIRNLNRVLVTTQVSKYRAFVFLPPTFVFDQKLIVFPLSKYCYFSVLQSSVHFFWASFFGLTLKDDPTYTPTDCFETFPFPKNIVNNTALENTGQAYYDYRASLLARNNEGLTKTYNRFHDPDNRSPEIVELREMQAAMDRIVLDAYGWPDLRPQSQFILQYEAEGEEDSARGKPWRYRWVDRDRDEVLARLLALNKQRAEEEAREGRLAAVSGHAAPVVKRKGKGTHDIGQGSLF